MPLGKKKNVTLFVLILGYFWCIVVTLVTLEKNTKNYKKIPNKFQKLGRRKKSINPKIKKNL